MTKLCAKCYEDRPIAEFRKGSNVCKSCKSAHHKKWRKDTDYDQRTRGVLRDAALSHYSNDDIKCNCCGEDENKFMCIDHIHGGGNKHRKTERIVHLYKWLRDNGYPEGFQVLCFNCNFAKWRYGVCPHTDA
jgi:hypothetical protein